MAVSETGVFEVMEVDEDGGASDLMLFAEDMDKDISLDIDLSRHSKYQQSQHQHKQHRKDQPQSQQTAQPREAANSIPAPSVVSSKASRSRASRIEVVVRKRPLNSREASSGETDITRVTGSRLTIMEPRLKVDLTKFTQLHDFKFDHCFDHSVTNAQIYETCVRPLFNTILNKGQHRFAGKATCFGYGQTGSGKTYTLLGCTNDAGEHTEGLYAMAVRDLFRLVPADNRIEVSFYEIYGGKLYDLLNGRRQILCREDGKQKVNIIGLTRVECDEPERLMSVISAGNAIRQTGSTGANNSSSRSHAILSMDVLPIRGRISFIDLAGSERGADTQNNNKQTRIEGAEINKSLLALKECIRALDMNSHHKPFRGSKLTQVLKESFMGNSRTLMVANISPNSGSCENTLNTLRYAYRVKELKNSQAPGSGGARGMNRNRSEPSLNHKGISRPSTATSRRQRMHQHTKKPQTRKTQKQTAAQSTSGGGSGRSEHLQRVKRRKWNKIGSDAKSNSANKNRDANKRGIKPTRSSTRSVAHRGQRSRSPSHLKSGVGPRRAAKRTKSPTPSRSMSSSPPPPKMQTKRSSVQTTPRRPAERASKKKGTPSKQKMQAPAYRESKSVDVQLLGKQDEEQEEKKRGQGACPMDADTAGEEDEVHEAEEVLNTQFSKKQLVKAHRKHIDEFMLLIKEDMQLLKSFDRDEHSIAEYTRRLKDVVARQEKAVKSYRDKVFSHSQKR